jgi:signal transduction histidine kinase
LDRAREEVRLRRRLRLASLVRYVVLTLCVAAVFLQQSFPFVFVVFVPFLWVTYKEGCFGAAVGIGIIGAIATAAKLLGSGPLTLLPDGTAAWLIATCVVSAYPVCSVRARQRELLASIAATEEELRRMADEPQHRQVEQMKESFIATVSHELRTPLTAINCALGIAQSGRLGAVDPAIARLLDIASSNGKRLTLLVDDIVDFDRLTTGEMKFSLAPHPVDNLLATAIAMNESHALQHKVRFVLGGPCGLSINVDAERFQQLMSNLLSNAAKFSHEGGLVWVDAARDGDDCVVRVIDRGIGIPASFRPRLFQRFAQADPSDARSHAGTGLGMAIAKELTQAMGGRIHFESEEGVGTTFYVAFPLVPDVSYLSYAGADGDVGAGD